MINEKYDATAEELTSPELDSADTDVSNGIKAEVSDGLAEQDQEIAPEESSPDCELDGDVDALAKEFPELSGLTDISELNKSERYLELRALGLTPEEAYLATRTRVGREDTRAHLRTAVPGRASSPISSMSARQMEEARELFHGMSDAEIRSLYKKVTK